MVAGSCHQRVLAAEQGEGRGGRPDWLRIPRWAWRVCGRGGGSGGGAAPAGATTGGGSVGWLRGAGQAMRWWCTAHEGTSTRGTPCGVSGGVHFQDGCGNGGTTGASARRVCASLRLYSGKMRSSRSGQRPRSLTSRYSPNSHVGRRHRPSPMQLLDRRMGLKEAFD
ncbi:Hypothetical predicted protein [Cloeon dipterum]|uniref:Uncharacterized protein n=1 Tax=Cloeon dipterum TaxID=197152 RepID=A0A8S1DEL8_9INSE|nr:Hypothetical predicted protein [Cloeon dipterum]